MPTVREYLRAIRLPFFMRKKFLLILAIVVLFMVLCAIVWTWYLYEEVVQSGGRIRWRHITQPFALPLIVLGIYAIFVLLWVAVKLKGMQGAVLTTTLHLIQPQAVHLGSGEKSIAEIDYTDRFSSDALMPVAGCLHITNQRFMHAPVVSSKRLGTLVGMQEPDVIFSLVHNHIRQCGFGLNEKHPAHFVVIENSAMEHRFGPISKQKVEAAMRELGWKETRAGELVYWIR
jgi:hypothetical protein